MRTVPAKRKHRLTVVLFGLAAVSAITTTVVRFRGDDFPAGNTAIIPAGKLEDDFYDWNQRHAAAMAIKDQLKPEVVLLGDSITHLWGGVPAETAPRGNRGADSWQALFGTRPALNLGFGWDRTQNVLRRIELGELDGLSPKAIVIEIGTNNLARSKKARENTPDEIAEAIGLILDKCRSKCPEARLILMAVFPRGEHRNDRERRKVATINERIAKFQDKPSVVFLDLTRAFLNPDGSIPKELMGDFLHPTSKGYAIWAEKLSEVLP